MSFFNKYLKLFHDQRMYQEIITGKVRTSLFFFSTFYLIFSLLTGMYINLRYVPTLTQSALEFTSHLKSSITPSSSFSIEEGQLFVSGLTTPIVIEAPAIIPLPVKNILFIDPTASVSGLATSSALFSFGTTEARFSSVDSTDVQIINYARDEFSGTITGAELQKAIDEAVIAITNLKPLAPLLIAVPVFIGMWFARLIFAALYSLLFTIGSSLLGRKYHYTQFLNIAFHTIILADTLNALIALIYGVSYPTLFTIAFFGATLIAVLNLPEKAAR